MTVAWLNDDEIDTWLKFRALVELFPSVIDAPLRRESGISFMEYQVLAMLSETDDRTLQISSLAQRTTSKLTRMSHLLTRLSERGLVERQASTRDARVTYAHLTDAGLALLESAAPGHVRQVRAAFLDVLSPAQLAQLDDICETILAGIDPEGVTTARPAPGSRGRDD
ncbi:MarR family transcriptional regulator [Propioniciclava soli]|uniref:MarR family transcriptional regulator n=1 Tax=Propioniciclava soli TaxID=2775081 RepID=A0ABZ3CAX8_9ACTN